MDSESKTCPMCKGTGRVKESNAKRVAELEAILDQEEDIPLTIMPNGEITTADGKRSKGKPLTMREDLGGEYGRAA